MNLANIRDTFSNNLHRVVSYIYVILKHLYKYSYVQHKITKHMKKLFNT